jgi:hypothetical protein
MNDFIERQRPVIERTGLGLLPGISLALLISLGFIAAIVIQEWWALALALGGIVAVTGVVVAVIMSLIGSEEDSYGSE